MQDIDKTKEQLIAELVEMHQQVTKLKVLENRHKQAEEQIRKLSHAIEQSPSIVMITNIKGNIEYINPKFTEITGFNAKEIIGRNAGDLGKQSPEEYKKMWDTISSGGEWRGTFYNKKKNGEFYWEAASISPVRNLEGVITNFIKVAEDITERKRADETLRKQHEQLKGQLSFTSALNRIAETIIFNDNTQIILETMAKIVGETLGVDRSQICDVDFERHLVIRLCEWLKPETTNIIATKGTYNLDVFKYSSQFMQDHRQWLQSHANNVSPHLIGDGSAEVLHKQMNIQSLLCYPFSFRNQGYYCLAFHQVSHHRKWQEEELEFLNSVAKMVEIAIQKIRFLTEHKRVEEKLRTTNQQLLNIIEFLPDATFVIDRDKKVIAWNRAMEEMTGVRKEDIIGKGDYAYAVSFYGKPVPILIDLIDSDESEIKTKPQYQNVKRKGNILSAETFVSALKGKERVFKVTSASLFDSKGNIFGAIESIHDITEQKQIEKQIKHLSLYDSVTGLYNRTYFEQEMRRLESGRYNPVGIIICDIDGLKLINDTLGHNTGDAVLLAAAGVIKKCFREGDMVARIGGDEFAILLPNSNKIAVENASHRIRNAVASYNAANPKHPLSISVGFAISNENSTSMNDLFKEADNNMYREKLHHSQSSRSTIVQTLMKALEARDFITEGHAERLQDLVTDVAEAIGLPERRVTDLRILAQFHDIGKVGIPDRILFKPGPLTPKEFTEMKRHCEIGYRIAQSSPDLVPIADWILKHHEWWNGKGYPLGLKGKEIPLECRILAIADAYDAITSDRPYQKAMSHEEAVAELKRCAGTQFDPQLVLKFVKVLENQNWQQKK